MTTALINDNDFLTSIEQALTNVEQHLQDGRGLPFMGLDKAGRWKYGREAIPVEPGSHWALDLRTAQHGHICWQEGKVADQVMASIAQPRPAAPTPDYRPRYSIEMICLDGADRGTRVLYGADSMGVAKAWDSLIKAIRQQLQNDRNNVIPIVELTTSHYDSKQYGRIYDPVLKVVRWDGLASLPKAGEQATVEAPKREPEVLPPEKVQGAQWDDEPVPAPRRRRVKVD